MDELTPEQEEAVDSPGVLLQRDLLPSKNLFGRRNKSVTFRRVDIQATELCRIFHLTLITA